MDFDPSEQESQIQAAARAFARTELLPSATQRDRTAAFPERELRALASLGLMGVNLPRVHGGLQAGMVAFSLAMQEIARADASVAVAMAVTNLVGEVICRFGTEAQRQEFIPGLTRGESVAGSFAVSELDAGSDLAAMSTTAVRTTGGWRLNGAKQWITSGDHAGVLIIGAKTDPQAGKKGISAFIVRGGTQGMITGPPEDKMGQRGSSTVPLHFTDCDLPEHALLGQLGGGLPIIYAALESGRIGIASLALGIGNAALDAAIAYAKQRVQFGSPISAFQGIQFALADVATDLEAAHLLTLRAARGKDLGRSVTREAAMAKLFASEAAGRATDTAMQVFGANGYMRKHPVERYDRDARVTRIYEGTSEVLRLVIARSIMEQVSGGTG